MARHACYAAAGATTCFRRSRILFFCSLFEIFAVSARAPSICSGFLVLVLVGDFTSLTGFASHGVRGRHGIA
jgi:hypothetical protein